MWTARDDMVAGRFKLLGKNCDAASVRLYARASAASPCDHRAAGSAKESLLGNTNRLHLSRTIRVLTRH